MEHWAGLLRIIGPSLSTPRLADASLGGQGQQNAWIIAQTKLVVVGSAFWEPRTIREHRGSADLIAF